MASGPCSAAEGGRNETLEPAGLGQGHLRGVFCHQPPPGNLLGHDASRNLQCEGQGLQEGSRDAAPEAAGDGSQGCGSAVTGSEMGRAVPGGVRPPGGISGAQWDYFPPAGAALGSREFLQHICPPAAMAEGLQGLLLSQGKDAIAAATAAGPAWLGCGSVGTSPAGHRGSGRLCLPTGAERVRENSPEAAHLHSSAPGHG